MTHLEEIAKLCTDLLLNYPGATEAQLYLDNRISKEAQELFQFGYFPDQANLEIFWEALNEDIIENSKLFYTKVIYDGILQNRVKHSILEQHNLIIPYHNVYGEIIALAGRTLLNEDDRKMLNVSKYKNSQFEKKSNLFGLHQSKQYVLDNDYCFVVEGQFDTISCFSNGLKNVVALGSSSMSIEQLALLMRYTDNIILMLDGDQAGQVGTEKIVSMFGKYANIRRCSLPNSFKDIDEFLKEYGVDELKSFIR